MKFLCQIWFDTEKCKLVPQAEWDAVTQECIISDNRWRDSGHLLVAHALHEPSTAITLRLHNGEVSATDGPFAEIKEHLGGFVLLEADNIEEAKTIASSFPILKYCSIEVRPAYSIQDGK
ncbi:YciI-related domain-containing protein [Rhizobium etli bv. phaseoli str. IE4803]|nr:YciI-related domain-containing protein [Rhizobium etli bv. phaseoli str. IE4803]